MTITITPTFKKNAEELHAWATTVQRLGPDGGKRQFHAVAKKVGKGLLSLLGVPGDVRSNLAGPAVTGDITVHMDRAYIKFSGDVPFCPPMFLYRTCNGRRDYTGGHNQWFQYQKLCDDPREFIDIVHRMVWVPHCEQGRVAS
jgi:hypothetical protein